MENPGNRKLPVTSSPILSVFDFDPEEIARQLTIIDFSLFAKIKPAELLNQVQRPLVSSNTSYCKLPISRIFHTFVPQM